MRRGDTLVTVADRFGVTVENLRAWNHLSSNRLAAGHTLYVTEPVRLAPTARIRRGRRGHARKEAHSSAAGKRSKAHSSSGSSSKRRAH
jgi:membrane-bound lytic murein transglycosylase D